MMLSLFFNHVDRVLTGTPKSMAIWDFDFSPFLTALIALNLDLEIAHHIATKA